MRIGMAFKSEHLLHYSKVLMSVLWAEADGSGLTFLEGGVGDCALREAYAAGAAIKI